MRVLWTHNADPARPNSLVFLDATARGLRERGVDLRVEYLGHLRAPRNVMRARRHVRALAQGFDVVHSQYGSACALVTAAARIPKILSIRGNDWNIHDGPSPFFYVHTRLARAMTRMSAGQYDCLMPVSERLAAELRRRWPRTRVETFPSPIDLSRFVPQDKATARAALGFPGDESRWVLFTAVRLDDPIKRFALAKEAFEHAQSTCRNLTWRVATGLDHVNMPTFVAACDVVLCTSETEGWPNSVKEALACNVPFVSTDVSDLRDIAGREPRCRVSAPDAEALAGDLCAVVSCRNVFGLRSHVADMNVEISVERLIRVYQQVIRAHSAN